MSVGDLFPRYSAGLLEQALADSPAVLLHGPRQCGKTTLAQVWGEPRGYDYMSFDDEIVRAAVQADPGGFVRGLPDRCILDKVQRVPELFQSLKLVIDRDRRPGRVLLTGSSNVLLLPSLSDSLAGRMEIVPLHPLSQGELERRRSRFLDALFDGSFPGDPAEPLGRSLSERVLAGGYPAALARAVPRRRVAWYRDYAETLVQRDVRDLMRIRSVDTVHRLLIAVAGQTSRMLNLQQLASPFKATRPTIEAYLGLLQRVFLVHALPAWHSNRLSRLIKSPKLHLVDTGLASALLGLDLLHLEEDRELRGQLVETFVVQEVTRQAGWEDGGFRLSHYRDREKREIDLIVERGRELAAVEVKAGATVRSEDFRAMRRLQEVMGDRFVRGVVLYDGERNVSFGERLLAVPIRRMWETG